MSQALSTPLDEFNPVSMIGTIPATVCAFRGEPVGAGRIWHIGGVGIAAQAVLGALDSD